MVRDDNEQGRLLQCCIREASNELNNYTFRKFFFSVFFFFLYQAHKALQSYTSALLLWHPSLITHLNCKQNVIKANCRIELHVNKSCGKKWRIAEKTEKVLPKQNGVASHRFAIGENINRRRKHSIALQISIFPICQCALPVCAAVSSEHRLTAFCIGNYVIFAKASFAVDEDEEDVLVVFQTILSTLLFQLKIIVTKENGS